MNPMDCLSCVLLPDRELKLSLKPAQGRAQGSFRHCRRQQATLQEGAVSYSCLPTGLPVCERAEVVSVAGVRWSTLVQHLSRSLSAICTAGYCAKLVTSQGVSGRDVSA